jgi:aspartate aminotransferase
MLSERMKLIKPSATLAITAKALERVAQGMDVISLSAGEPDFDTPVDIKLAAIDGIQAGHTKYTAVAGIASLRKAISNKLRADYGLECGLNQIIVGNGAKQVIFNALLATLNPGDEVIIPTPYWVSYPDMVLLAGGQPIFVHSDINSSFKISPQQLEQAITQRTKWFILNSPNNPSGAVYQQDELSALADVLRRYDHVHILTDDIYESIIFDDESFIPLIKIAPDLKDRVMVVNGFSKSHAMTGWRIGYGAGSVELVKAMTMLQSQSTSNVCSISQDAALAALSESPDMLCARSALFERRRNLVMQLLKDVPGLRLYKPQGAFYLFIDCQKLYGKKTVGGCSINSSADFVEYLLDDYLVAVVPGEGFGLSGYFRISYAIDEERLAQACDRIKTACYSLI